MSHKFHIYLIIKGNEANTTKNTLVNTMFAFKDHSDPGYFLHVHLCYQFRILRNLRIDIKDRLEEYSQSIEIDIHACTQSQEKLL